MKKITLLLMTLMVIAAGCSTNYNPQNKGDQNTSHNIADFPTEEISEAELNALNLTLNDEFRAEAIYQKVLDKFGEVKPFSNIIKAEQTHSNKLLEIYAKYNLQVPENNWYEIVPEFESVQDACIAGVEAEIENAALYDDLMNSVDNADIIVVFTSLRDASLNNHLPAFQRCS